MSLRFSKGSMAVLLAAAAAMSASPLTAGAADHSFSDVRDGTYYAKPVQMLHEDGIIGGYPDNTFRPNESISRQHAAALLARALGLGGGSTSVLDRYADVDGTNPFAANIAALTEAGIMEGYDGRFFPDNEITREQMASIMVRAYELADRDNDGTVTINLSNVHTSHQQDVQVFADLSLTTELGDFMPKSSLTRAQFATFLQRTLGLGDGTEFQLSVLHTNDLHGRTDTYPQMITAVNELRSDYPDALLLEAGDIFSGTLYFNEFRGLDAAAFMSMMEYDAFVPGNHEFDLGDDDGFHPDLAAFFEAGGFPIVASNLDFSADPNFDGMQPGGITSDPEDGSIYDGIIKEVDGEEVGIFGLDTEDTVNISSAGVVEFDDIFDTAERMVSEFEDAGVDKIIALTHLGYDTRSDFGNDVELAENVDGIDIIVGGHSHTEIEPPDVITRDADGNLKEPTVIAQAGEYGNNLGEIQVLFDDDGVVNKYAARGELHPIEEFDADPAAAEMLVPYTEAIEELQNQETGITAGEAFPNPRLGDDGNDGTSVRNSETALGNLISDAYLYEARQLNPEVDIALQNAGGIRTSLDAGPVTTGELISILPFGNRLSIMELTGAEILAALEHSVRNVPDESGGFLQVAGMCFTFDSSRPAGERVLEAEIDRNGDHSMIMPNETYLVATNNFTAAGGDGFDMFAQANEDGRVSLIGKTDWEILRDYALLYETITPQVQERITNIAE
ncbi:5'-nucleotidase C-terminal domain-containing protein [Alkalicoccus urumqiensis]|uniref:Bifunctional metallophosphatase/5'-nucleotidase n=1 Tax=Alkalicoccus urumqiensis TaxID=1548213 RepID=A0A2P6ML35_ALKUR|nr:5'-nucleotidase C-terminal domain-containing protein [Alkalicoccus urumqiensis]PRO66992.1 bifunctional metallophosphatase/5'-nucleotidase [Alkalicoccus urumqiensis]